MQSISKVATLLAAIEHNGCEKAFSIVGMEPAGDAFNSVVRLALPAGSRPFDPIQRRRHCGGVRHTGQNGA